MWNYNPNLDYDALSPSLPNTQQGTGGNLQASKAGYDPLWLYSEYGDRLRLLPADLYDAVFEAMRGGTTDPFLAQYVSVYSNSAVLNRVWVSEAKVYLPELE